MEIQKLVGWKSLPAIQKPFLLARSILAKNMVRLYSRQTFIGVMGLVGKTSTILACDAVLSSKMDVLVSEEVPNPALNLLSTLNKLKPSTKKVILELDTTSASLDYYLSLVQPATVIVTRDCFANCQLMGTVEAMVIEQLQMLKYLPQEGLAILNFDDPYIRKIAEGLTAKVVFYGTDKDNCFVWVDKIRLDGQKTHFEINCGVERVEVTISLLGRHFVYSCLAAAVLGKSLGLSLIAIKKGLEKIKTLEHVMQPIDGYNNSLILDDTQNSHPATVEEAINTLNEVPARRRIAILGEMKDLGAVSEQMHRKIAQKLYNDKVDLVYLGGGDTKFIAEELRSLGFLPERIEENLGNSSIVAKVLKTVSRGDVVLVKCAKSARMDEVVKRISKVVTGPKI